MELSWLTAGILGTCVACAGGGIAPMVPRPPPPPSDDHLLYQPTGDAVSLLGRAISEGANGQLVVADERAPGCQVTAHEVLSSWNREYDEDIGSMAFASALASVLGGLQGQYGSQIRTRFKVQNVKELLADLSGPCGNRVIKSVKIGTGTRDLFYRKEAGVAGKAGVAGLVVAGEGRDWHRIGDGLAWEDQQAWSFTVGNVAGTESIRLAISMPTELTDGDSYTISVSAARQVWLIALCVEADGSVGILLPNGENPDVVVGAGQAVPLPAMQVSLRDRVAAREKVVLFAFTHSEDYDDFRPPAGNVADAEARAYYQALPERLSALPRRRWERREITYLVKPGAAR